MKKLFIGFLLTLTLVIATFATWVYSQIDSALPIIEGKQTLFGLSNTATVERDEQGIVTISADNRLDVAIATGFVHAQERFFQMDLLRKNSAGELSSLFGEVAVDYDKSIRRHRFRDRAREIIKQLPEDQYRLIQAYTRGVNQGLNYLQAPPFEYLLLRQSPVEWQEEDTILTVLSMYLDLQYHDGRRELTLAAIKSTFGMDVFQFLNPKGSRWDATIDGSKFPETTNSIPLFSDHFINSTKGTDSNKASTPLALLSKRYQEGQFPGSNNWAVSGALSTTGSAIVANDMHLGLRVPNTWFRASFSYTHGNKKVTVTGLTLPGTPNIVVGSNGNIAWGFTNSYGDWSDVIILQTNEDNSQYLTPNGYKPFDYHSQMIAIKNKKAIEIELQETMWGPVIGKNSNGQLLAYRWVAHDINSVNLNHIKLEYAKDIDQAFIIAASAGIPAQNLMIADKQGNIGWTIMGPIPIKKGQVGELPTSWSNGDNAWQGYLTHQKYPKIKNPQTQRLWTANSRVVGGEMLKTIGDGGYALGARSSQIRQSLNAKTSFNEESLLAIALDDKAVFLQRWQSFLIEQLLNDQSIINNKAWQVAKALIVKNKLHATTDSVAYRLIRNFRLNVRDMVFEKINLQLKINNDSYNFRSIRHQIETPLWQLINQQPRDFIASNTNFNSWHELLTSALDLTLKDMSKHQPLNEATWGKQNTTAIQHPLSKAVPFIGRYLDMPDTQLSGDSYMPKVQGKAFGASQRMVVSPGHEDKGILHMPTSQAGHPWSPYYGKGHSDWEQGLNSKFLPGKTQYTLTLFSF